MAETAAILNPDKPDKTVLIPDAKALYPMTLLSIEALSSIAVGH